MARASTPTLLSLDRFAQVLGINPSHFNGAGAAEVTPIAINSCQDLWPQYSWQSADRVSREDLATEIANAERDIADRLGWWVAPMWLTEEVRQYPKYHRPDILQYGRLDVKGYEKGIKTRWGNVIAPGRRALTLVGTDTVAYTDADGDGYNETATVSIATTLTDAREVKVYFTGRSGAREWEIRPARTKAISAGTFTATFWAWQFIDPALWEALTTTAGFQGIDWTDAGNLVTDVDVYREFNDTTQVSAQFYWEPRPSSLRIGTTCTCGGTGCVACQLTTQDGCLHVRDAIAGAIVPQAATYDADEGTWEATCQTECRDPDYVKLWYYAGLIDDRYLADENADPLSHWWAQTIAWLAVARLERPFCSCANLTALAQDLRTDLAFMGAEASYATTEDILGNPFGTRKGEVKAWLRVNKLAKKRGKVAVI